MKNKKRFVPWLIAAVIIAAFAVIGKKLYDLMFGGSLAVTTEDLKNGIIACSPAIIFIVVVLIAALIVVVAAGKLKQPKRALVRAQAPIAILLAITLSVNWVILGVEYSVVNSVFAEDVKVSDETMASGRAIADQIASEGIVLLKNDDKALPLSAGTKLNLFGWSSVRPLYGGTGSGDSDTSNAVSLIDGLKHAGFEVNEELVKFYENFRTERPVGTIRLREIGSKRGDFTVPEPTIAEYENANIFEDVLFTNLKGTFFCTKAASRLMMRQRYGRIINISSVVGLHGNAGQANYAASKAGLIGLTKSVAKEYAARNITANAVAPGFIETDMTAAMPESARAAAAAAIPAGRIGRAEDVAAAVAFLAGEQAGYITGQVLCVDGGMGM